MAISADIDELLSPQTAFNLTTTQFALRLRDTAAACSQDDIRDITVRFLEDIHSGALPPLFFRIWLQLAARRVPTLIKVALLDKTSHGIRQSGIYGFKVALASARWKEDVWDAVGGARGLIEAFESLSIEQVQCLAQVIRQFNRSQDPAKAAAVDELVRLLIPILFSSSASAASPSRDSTRQRFLFAELAPLIPACSAQLVLELFSKPLPNAFYKPSLFRGLATCHLDLLRKIAAGAVEANQDARIETIRHCSKMLILSTAPYESRDSRSGISSQTPSGVLFFLDMVTSKLDLPGDEKSKLFQQSIQHATDLALRRKLPSKDVSILLEIIISTTERWKGYIGIVNNRYDIPCTFSASVVRYLVTVAFSKDGIGRRGVKRTFHNLLEPRPEPSQRSTPEALLIRMVKLGLPLTSTWEFFRYFSHIFEQDVPEEAMLPFIKIMCRYHRGIEVDLERRPLLGQRYPEGLAVDGDILLQLPPDDAKWLFDRVKSLAGLEKGFNFRSVQPPLNRLSVISGHQELEPILHIIWEAKGASSAGKGRAEKLLQDAKRKAESESTGHGRRSAAIHCIHIAVAISSIDLVSNVFRWIRRFIRDPFAGPNIQSYINTSSMVAEVFSCTALPTYRPPKSRPELVSIVDHANDTLSFHIETSYLLMREPGAMPYQYNVAHLLGSVVSARIAAIPALSKAGISDEADLENILLASMESILLKGERMMLLDTRDDSSWMDLKGCLTNSNFTISKRPREYELRFLDNLARKRNELWLNERIERDPIVADVEGGWPNGLPLQYLLPDVKWAAAALRDQTSAPFVTSRVKDVVFCNQTVVLSTAPQKTGHVTLFCDSLQYGMQAYIGFNDPEPERRSRLLEIWRHYSDSEWQDKSHVYTVTEWLVEFAKDHNIGLGQTALNQMQRPIIRCFDNMSAPTQGPMEWDPQQNEFHHGTNEAGHTTSNYDSFPTLLQFRFCTQDNEDRVLVDRGKQPSAWKETPPSGRESFFKLDMRDMSVRKLPMSIKEGIVVSAILFLDATFAAGSRRLLSKPFPENSPRIRYPALYLDYDFLASAKGNEAEDAAKILKTLVGVVPPALLHALARALLNAVAEEPQDSVGYTKLLKITVTILKLLPQSDNPELAADTSLDVIRALPNDSSWYRHVASPRLINRISPDSADRLAKEFALIILDGLKKQKESLEDRADVEKRDANSTDRDSTKASEAVDTTAKPPFVKISTIKMLAQLLPSSSSFPLRTSLNILESLFAASKHIDVRKNVISAVLELLTTSVDMEPEATNKIYAIFKSFVGIAAAPSERKIVSEDAWLKAEAGGPLPEVNISRPLKWIVTHEAKNTLPERFHAGYVRDTVLPLIEESTRQNSRWMRIFLSRLDLTEDETSVTNFGPFDTTLIDYVFDEWAEYIPSNYLLPYRASVMMYDDMLKLRNIPKKMEPIQDGWLDTDDGCHVTGLLWSRTWKRPFDTLAERMLDPTWTSKIADGVTRQQLIDEYYIWATFIIEHPVKRFNGSTPVVNRDFFKCVYKPLRDAYLDDETSPEARQKYIPELWKRITSYVENKRSSSGNTQPLEKPLILPPSILLNSLLLPYPHLNRSDAQSYNIYADVICGLINQCATSTCCMFDFKELKRSIQYVKAEDTVQCAVNVGKLSDKDHSRPDGHLKVQFALKLLGKLDKAQIMNIKELTELFNSWKASPNEGIRLAAWNWESGCFDSTG